ncbi:zinc finger protein 668-like isoform X3 [Cloeon dipterum]|uniref:zinc finger protein 668-like isoform X3 n=1 Tax=Cloeon dipterum TaxID=197152 RepID=UPI00321F99ED
MGPDLMNNCRICLMENNIMIPIFGEDGAYRKIREMIRDSLNITVFQGDPLPRKICCKCYFKLQQACQLKADCQRTTKFYISNLNGQRSPDAIRAVKTLNHQLNILQGTAYISHAHHKDQEGAGPSRNLTSNQDHSQAIRHRNHRLPPFNTYSKPHPNRTMLQNALSKSHPQQHHNQQQQQQPQPQQQPKLQPQVRLVPIKPKPSEPEQPEESNVTHECGMCFRICKSKATLRMHVLQVHKDADLSNLDKSPVVNTEPSTSSPSPALHENLQCSLCSQPFRNVNGLVGHLRTNHGKPSCSICLEIFSTQEELNAHRQTHKPGYVEQPVEKQNAEVFSCPICSKSFDNATSLSRHKGYHTKMGPNWTPSDVSSSVSVVSSPSVRTTPTSRQTATMSRANSPSLQDHPALIVHTCHICGKKFDNNLSLARHRANHAKHGIPQRSLIPPQRHRSPTTQELSDGEPVEKKPLIGDDGKVVDRVSLQKLKSNATSIPFCLYCKKIYDSQDKLWEHICLMHPNDPRYRCQEQGCLRVFFSGTGFRSHQTAQGHNAPPETANSNKSVESGPSLAFLGSAGTAQMISMSTCKCHICMRRFSNINNLKRHMKMAHRTASGTSLLRVNANAITNNYSRKVSRVMCRYCPKYLSSKYIAEHEKMHRIRGDKPRIAQGNGGPPPEEAQGHHVMPDEEEIEADVDVEEEDEQEDNPINSLPDSITVTQNPSEFKLHRKQPREPVCRYCNHTAPTFYELREHLESEHPGQVYYVCGGCPEIYYDRKTLVSHCIVHTRVYLRCKHCGKSFARPLALRGHENRCLFLQKKQNSAGQAPSTQLEDSQDSSSGFGYNCEFCTERFTDSMAFVQHLQTHAT